MALKNGNPCLITFALCFAGHAQFMKVKKAARNCKKSSAGTLRGILEYAKDSEWGKAHNFADILAAKVMMNFLPSGRKIFFQNS